MLYLLITFGRSSKKRALKVGYTGDQKSRMDHYKIHNPFIEFIATREGSEYEEIKLHMYLKSYNLKEKFLNEWFIDSNETRQRFHAPFERINKRIWEYRDSLFSGRDMKSEDSLKKKIYEELRMIYGVSHEHTIDRLWKIESNKKILKSLKNNNYE